MSADNWTSCPECKRKNEKGLDELSNKLQKDYGKVSFDTFQKSLVNIEKEKNLLRQTIFNERKLREDYTVGIIDETQFTVKYKAKCEKCDFTFDYKVVLDVLNLDTIDLSVSNTNSKKND